MNYRWVREHRRPQGGQDHRPPVPLGRIMDSLRKAAAHLPCTPENGSRSGAGRSKEWPVSSNAFASCPTDVVNAPVEVVWSLLTDAAGWGDFFDIRVRRVEPPGPAVIGQRWVGESGPRFLHLKVSFEFTRIDAEHHKLGFTATLPLGITVREELDCAPVGAKQCRVNYHCNFAFLEGLRGRVTRLMLRRELVAGPADSLLRLKRAAERAYGSMSRR
jgi:hypothetical protein